MLFNWFFSQFGTLYPVWVIMCLVGLISNGGCSVSCNDHPEASLGRIWNGMLKPSCCCVCGHVLSLSSKNYTGSISGKRILSVHMPTIEN